MKMPSVFRIILAGVFTAPIALAKTSSRDIDKTLKRFVAAPHPMGSDEQKKLASEYERQFKKFGWKAQLQTFSAEVPNAHSQKFGGKEPANTVPVTLKKDGVNVVGFRAGALPCALVVGGHYDTKHFDDFKFVGANDGGSSTAMILEVARALGKAAKKKDTALQNCDLHFVLFDGEEATLTEWSAAEERGFGSGDHLYGSAVFAENIAADGKIAASLKNKEVVGTFVFDMIGHKQQKLIVTNGSDAVLSQAFVTLAKNQNIDIERSREVIEDDHVPFAKRGSRFVHIIDWTNLQEWHTAKDTLDILDSRKIARLADAFVSFLKETKYEK